VPTTWRPLTAPELALYTPTVAGISIRRNADGSFEIFIGAAPAEVSFEDLMPPEQAPEQTPAQAPQPPPDGSDNPGDGLANNPPDPAEAEPVAEPEAEETAEDPPAPAG
jgi:hypothetical protein